MFFTKRELRELTRDNFRKKVGCSSFFMCSGIKTYRDFIKLLGALPRYVTKIKLPKELFLLPEINIQKILKRLPETVREVDLFDCPFERMALNLRELPPWIEKLFICAFQESSTGAVNYHYVRDHFYNNPDNYSRNIITCIASIPSSVRCLSLKGQALGEWSHEALLELAAAIPLTVEALDLSHTELGLCQTELLIMFFSALQVSELSLSMNNILPGLQHRFPRGQRRTVQEVIEILSAFSDSLEVLYAYNTFLGYNLFRAPVDSQETREILKAMPSGVRTLSLCISQEEFPAAFDELPPSVRKFIGASNFRAERQVCHKSVSVKTFIQLDPVEIEQRFLDAGAVTLMGYPSCVWKHELERYNHGVIERLPLLHCSELHLPDFNFWGAPAEYAHFFEGLHPNVTTLNLSDNTSLAKNPQNFLALIRSMPNTVIKLHLDNIELGSRLSTRELIELFQEIPRHLHLSLSWNNLFTARTRKEYQEILSAIRESRAMTTETLMDHNGGESDANRALPALKEAVEKGILPLEMAAEILSFLVPRNIDAQKMILEEPEELKTPYMPSGCCTIL